MLIVLKVAVLLVIGIILGKLLGKIFSNLLKRIKIDFYVSQRFRISHIISTLAEWCIYVLFLKLIFDMLEIKLIATFLGNVVLFLPNLIEAVIIITIGLVVSKFVRSYLEPSEFEYKDVTKNVVSFFISYIAIATALSVIGIDTFLIDMSMLIVTIGAGISIVIAIGFGFRDIMIEQTKWIIPYVKRWKRI